MKEIEILYDHYKDSFSQQVKDVEKRNKYFFILLILVSFLLFNVLYGNSFSILATSLLQKWAEVDISIDWWLLKSLVLFSILWVSLLYFKAIITVNRGFKYLKHVEKNLTNGFDSIIISREGEFYKQNKTSFSGSVGFFYRVLFPILIPVICSVAVILNLIQDFSNIVIVDLVQIVLIVYVAIAFLFKKQPAT